MMSVISTGQVIHSEQEHLLYAPGGNVMQTKSNTSSLRICRLQFLDFYDVYACLSIERLTKARVMQLCRAKHHRGHL